MFVPNCSGPLIKKICFIKPIVYIFNEAHYVYVFFLVSKCLEYYEPDAHGVNCEDVNYKKKKQSLTVFLTTFII